MNKALLFIMIATLNLPVVNAADQSEAVTLNPADAVNLQLKNWSHEYVVAHAGGNKKSLTLRKDYLEKCSARLDKDPYCQYMADRFAVKPVAAKATPAHVSLAAKAIHTLNLEHTQDIGNIAWQRAFKKYSTWKPLEAFSAHVLQESACTSSSLYYALALKAEEFFPDLAMRNLAIRLNGKVVECEKDSLIRYKALYRQSLILIWDDRCEETESALQELVKTGIYDYAPRAMYWQYQCALKNQKTDRVAEIRDTLLKKFPLSFHGLFLNRGVLPAHLRLGEPGTAVAVLRSVAFSDANLWIRAAEILIEAGRRDLSQNLITRLAEKFIGLEPGVRLYLSALQYQSKDYVGNFRILSQAFRDEPSMINRKTLELFYPLNQFELIKKASFLVSGDPLMFASLIRQESGFNENARSPVGAAGLMQLMPATARMYGVTTRAQLFHPETNLRVGVRFFTALLRKYEGDAELALAAYNAGSHRVENWLRRYPTSSRMLFLDLIPFAETRDYVALISRNYYWYRTLYLSQQTRQIASDVSEASSNATRPKFSLMSPN